jgi:hypothetical protein
MNVAQNGAMTPSQEGGLTAPCLASMGQGGRGHLQIWQKCLWTTKRIGSGEFLKYRTKEEEEEDDDEESEEPEKAKKKETEKKTQEA